MSEPLTAPEVDAVQGAVLKHFILGWRETHFYLVGPFETRDAAHEWATLCVDDGDRWAYIRLACVSGTAATIEVRKPEARPMT